MTTEGQKLKILYHHRVAAQDGQSVHIRELVAAFERQGHEIVFVGPSIRPSSLGEENRLLKWMRRLLPRFVMELMELAYGFRVYFKLKAAYEKHNQTFCMSATICFACRQLAQAKNRHPLFC